MGLGPSSQNPWELALFICLVLGTVKTTNLHIAHKHSPAGGVKHVSALSGLVLRRDL